MAIEFPTYTVRVMRDGELISDITGGDVVSAESAFYALEKFYLNAPDSSASEGVTVQMFRESDDFVELEITF